MADLDELNAELRRIGKERDALEERAGIKAAIERAREGPLMPDMDASHDEYLADCHDYERSNTRDAYFGVADVELRKALIAAQRRSRATFLLSLEAEVDRDIKALGLAEAAANRSFPILRLTYLAGGIGLGLYGGHGLVGALIGGTFGYFCGQWHTREKKSEGQAEITRRKEDVKLTRKTFAHVSRQPEFFSEMEQETGARDAAVDRESAYGNLARQRLPAGRQQR